jgi:two-component SAPR family response regulator
MSKILYIDECQLEQFILKKILSRYGSSCEVKCTDTCIGVLSLLSQRRLDEDKLPDIILLDIYIPGLNAWDFLDKVKWLYPTLPKPIDIYLLSTSTCTYYTDVERAKQYRFVKAFMLKPLTKEILQKLIRQMEAPVSRFAMLEASN